MTAAVGVGCTAKIPPPKPPPFAGEVIEIDIGEVFLADRESASHAIEEPIDLPRKAMLRVKGVYHFVDSHKDLPINIDLIRREKNGKLASHSGGASSPDKRTSTTFSFTTDLLAPASGGGEFELRMRAGERFIAHGKVVVKD